MRGASENVGPLGWFPPPKGAEKLQRRWQARFDLGVGGRMVYAKRSPRPASTTGIQDRARSAQTACLMRCGGVAETLKAHRSPSATAPQEKRFCVRLKHAAEGWPSG